MARALTALVLAEIAAASLRPVAFYEGEFSGGTLNLWSGIGTISWDSKTWTGAGQMLSIAPVEEASDIRASAFSVTLSGESSALVAINLSQARQGLAGRVWLGFLDSTGSLIADPFKSFEGRLDVPELSDDGVSAMITVRYESRLIDLDRVRDRRYTAEDQKMDYPSDEGFAFVEGLQDKQISWGPIASEQAAKSGGFTSRERKLLATVGQFFPDFGIF